MKRGELEHIYGFLLAAKCLVSIAGSSTHSGPEMKEMDRICKSLDELWFRLQNLLGIPEGDF